MSKLHVAQDRIAKLNFTLALSVHSSGCYSWIDDINERLFLKGRGKLSMAIKHVQLVPSLRNDNAFNARRLHH